MMFPSTFQLLPVYGDACMAEHRSSVKLPDAIKTSNGGSFDVFSDLAWKAAG